MLNKSAYRRLFKSEILEDAKSCFYAYAIKRFIRDIRVVLDYCSQTCKTVYNTSDKI